MFTVFFRHWKAVAPGDTIVKETSVPAQVFWLFGCVVIVGVVLTVTTAVPLMTPPDAFPTWTSKWPASPPATGLRTSIAVVAPDTVPPFTSGTPPFRHWYVSALSATTVKLAIAPWQMFWLCGWVTIVGPPP